MNPTPHSSNRMFEWAAGVIMLQIGLGVMAAIILGIDPSDTFSVFHGFGLQPGQVGVLFVAIGGMRCTALYCNGRWRHYGCYTRAAGSAGGVFLWMQLFYGVVVAIVHSRLLYVGVFVWATFSIFDFLSLCRAILDCSTYYRVSDNAARHS